MSLLSKAKSFPVNQKHNNDKVSDDVIELAIAFIKHEITAKQGAHALGSNESKFQQQVVHATYYAIRNSILVLKK